MKKKLPYLLTCLISLMILLLIFYLKKIYPFGDYSLVWGDMYDQIMAFYFHMYDSFYDGMSLLFNPTTGGTINFFGVITYYIFSPVSLILLLFPREELYGAITIVCSIKILLSSITSLYFLRTYFRKLPNSIAIMLALSYAFSNYMIINYQITAWIDAMYLFPLVLIGLKKVLDKENPRMYIITLAISLICSFYVTLISILFILMAAFIYIVVYKEKEDRKKTITSLGISTVLALGISAVIIIPTYLQISESARVAFNLKTLLTSKTGPITEKIAVFAGGGILYTAILLLLKNYKDHKKFLKFYIPIMLLLLVPVIVEPIHKLWHFGSFAGWPYRYGYITVLFFIIGAAYYFQNVKQKAKSSNIFKILTIVATLFCGLAYLVLAFKYKDTMQNAIYHFSLSKYTSSKVILIAMLGLSFVPSFINMFFYNKFSKKLIVLSTIICIFSSSYIFLGMDSFGDNSRKLYNDYLELAKTHKEDDYYRVKEVLEEGDKNFGMLTKYHSIDQFTSLTNRNTLETMKLLGYSSYWVNTSSKGSNYFIDSIMANKYLITKDKVNTDFYTLIEGYNSFDFYKFNYDVSYGYLLNSTSDISKEENSFARSNAIYKDITGDENLFTTYEFELNNIKKVEQTKEEFLYLKDNDSYFIKELDITDKSTLYLEIFRNLNNTDDYDNHDNFNIYINDTLYLKNAYTKDNNNVLNLGTYENQKVTIKVEILDNVTLKNITLGLMNNSKFSNFITNNKIDTKVKYNKNKINIKYNSSEEKILFLPITYSKNYKITNNNKVINPIRVYENYIGIKLNKGENNINFTYVPKGLVISLIISIFFIAVTIILLHTKIFEILICNKIIHNIAYYSYLFIYLQLVIIHILLLGAFIISYLIR